ncbi:hypothetical protein BTHERMOSOX_255 [Bathymodiolus thermophilus thioautotrophic gill symbiont]|uniref:P-loop NTPase fold protein n=1 Tax=Bathymodiolus thermophilus thioautotrophic gill symbiont TaxID=2360 RepID=UPI0010BB8A86|nr:P-loop NTPase fold protein [Bathymodiolus thermophilus thioautotrophic gill symbiont]SHA12735.1 hypothetical protein BTHERMOSOX_255 [Bathymodiolus thermophilus thioautotrophic gill symbiont]
MSVKNLEERLANILGRDDAVVVSINGKWGVGKTYFWNEFKDKLTSKKITSWYKFNKKSTGQKTAYISLFGKEKISDIRADIFLQVISKSGHALENLKKLLKGIKVPYINTSALITLLDNKDFKDVIVCFDDFERLSSSMKLEEVLGLISELKEQKNCKVVMILNEGELESNNKKTFAKYKEKLIDYEFDYNPKPSESLDILKSKLAAFTDYPLEDYLTKHKINNIRIIGRIINALNDFSFIQTYIKDAPEVTTEIVGSIIEIAAINAQVSSFSDFIEYVRKRSPSLLPSLGLEETDKLIEDKRFEGLLSLIGDDHNKLDFLQSDIASELIKYCQTSLVNEESFIRIVEPKVENRRLYSVHKDIGVKRDKHLYDMSYGIDAYTLDLWKILEKEIITESAFSPEVFLDNIQTLENLDSNNKQKYHNFAIERLKEFIQGNLDWMKNAEFDDLQKILDFDVKLSDFYKECIENNHQEAVNPIEKIIILMRDEENCDYEQRVKHLSQLSQEEIKQHILDNAEYFKEVDGFLYSYGHRTEFAIYVKNVVSVLRELSQSKNKNHAHKALDMVDFLEKNNKISKP